MSTKDVLCDVRVRYIIARTRDFRYFESENSTLFIDINRFKGIQTVMVASTKKQKPIVKASIGKPMKSVKLKMDVIGKPKYSEMIKYAISSLKERRGSSRQAILKFILEFYDVSNDKRAVNNYLKQALRAGVKNGKLKQLKGTGASGSFRLGEPKDKTKSSKTNITTKTGVKKKVKEKQNIKKEKPEKTTKPKVKKEWTVAKTVKGKQPPKKGKRTSNKKTSKTGKQRIKKEKKTTKR